MSIYFALLLVPNGFVFLRAAFPGAPAPSLLEPCPKFCCVVSDLVFCASTCEDSSAFATGTDAIAAIPVPITN
ncbi:MAG: hypothetical protein LBP35_06030 [Candidatus Ancillula trichonymphae]|nr:hypothetical protein [Candidatus Ancillula trichonymphae]